MNLLKSVNKETFAIGLLIISIGFQIIPLRVEVVEKVVGTIIIVIGIYVLNNAKEEVGKKA